MQLLLNASPPFRSTDLDQVEHHIGQIFCPHRLSIQHSNQTLNTQLYYKSSPHLGLGQLRYGASVHIKPQPLSHFYLLQVPLSGHEQIHLQGQSFDYGQGTASMVNPTDEFEMQHCQQANKLFVRIHKQRLHQFYEHHYQRPLTAPLCFEPLLSLKPPAGQSVWRLLQWLYSEIDQGSLLLNAHTAPHVENNFFASLLSLWPHNQHPTSAPVVPHSLQVAKAYILQHLAHPLQVSTIAQAAGMSERSLYAGFKKYFALSPMHYVKQQRLQRAHQQLQRASPQHSSVTHIAYGVGFSHLGQFAADYQRYYGETPSTTLQRSPIL